MPSKDNKDLITRYYRESSGIGTNVSKHSAVASAYPDPKAVFHSADGDMNLEQATQFFVAFYRAFPDTNWAVDDMVAEASKVVVRYTWTGTQTGEWRGAAPTGKRYTQRGITIYRIAGGKVAEGWSFSDAMKAT